MKAKFNNKIKEQIYERDWKCCIICWVNYWLQFHHVFFWLEANRWKDRNNIDQWVTLCSECHTGCHSCKSWTWVRKKSVNYINNIYN